MVEKTEIYKDKYECTYQGVIDEKGTGYYILKNGKKILYQYPPYIPYEMEIIKESAIAHIQEIIKEANEEIKERISIEDLQKQINDLKTENEELKKINAEQDTMLAELAML